MLKPLFTGANVIMLSIKTNARLQFDQLFVFS